VARELKYLEQAVAEAEGAARWYAERSPTAATRFSAELDAAEAAILEHPAAWPPMSNGNRHYLTISSAVFLSVSCIGSRSCRLLWWPLPMAAVVPTIVKRRK
jgi:plasmid stabilization system protein ParE